MTGASPLIATAGGDPIWAVWREWADEHGITLVAHPAPGAAIVLVSPWDQPAVDAVRAAVAAVGGRTDVWLIRTGPSPGLLAEVLAAGGRGCLPRVPDDASLRRMLAVAAWWPTRQAPPPGVVGTEPEARSRAGAREGGAPWGWRRALAGIRVPRAARRQPAPRTPRPGPVGGIPSPAGGEPLVVLGPWPLPEGTPESVLRSRLRSAHGWAAGTAEGTATCLGCVPPPLRGQPHPAVVAAAAARRVAVVASVDWAVLAGARALIAALRSGGAPEIEVWLTGERPGQTLLRQVSFALQAPCLWVPPEGAGQAAGGRREV